MTTDRDRRQEWQSPASVDQAQRPREEEQLLTVIDVCAWFKVTRDWVYDEVEAGRLRTCACAASTSASYAPNLPPTSPRPGLGASPARPETPMSNHWNGWTERRVPRVSPASRAEASVPVEPVCRGQ